MFTDDINDGQTLCKAEPNSCSAGQTVWQSFIKLQTVCRQLLCAYIKSPIVDLGEDPLEICCKHSQTPRMCQTALQQGGDNKKAVLDRDPNWLLEPQT